MEKGFKRLEEKANPSHHKAEQKNRVWGEVLSQTVEPQPNAPLLKRIIKNPKTLGFGYMTRTKDEPPEKRLVYQADNTLLNYLRSDKRVRK